MSIPQDCILFIDHSIYQYRAKLEAAVAAFYLGYHAEAIELNSKVISCEHTPDNLVELSNRNMQLSLEIQTDGQNNAA